MNLYVEGSYDPLRSLYTTLKLFLKTCLNRLTRNRSLCKVALIGSKQANEQNETLNSLTLNNAKELQMNTTQNTAAQNNVTAIANAMNAAHLLAKEAAANAGKPVEEMHTVIVRVDVQNRPAIFFPDSYKKDEHTIDAWSGEKNSTVYTTNADYYFTSRPADASIVEEMSKKYTDRFKVKKLLVRQRLYKSGTQVRADNPSVPGDQQAAMREFADRLVASVTKAIYAALDPQ